LHVELYRKLCQQLGPHLPMLRIMLVPVWSTCRSLAGSRRLLIVAQVSNLLYRRLPVGRPWANARVLKTYSGCGLETRDTADWKSALQDLSKMRCPSHPRPDLATLELKALSRRRIRLGWGNIMVFVKPRLAEEEGPAVHPSDFGAIHAFRCA
jgi:hypothetical protein